MLVAHWLLSHFRNRSGIGARPERAVVERVGLRLRQRPELGHRIDVEAGGDRDALDEKEQPRDQGEILVGVIGQLVEQERIERQRAVIDHADRVAVGVGLRALLGGRDAAGAAAVLDHQLLAEPGGELGRRRPHDHVGDAAGGDRHDHPDRPVGVGLRGRRRRERGKNTAGENARRMAHDVSAPLTKLHATTAFKAMWHRPSAQQLLHG